MIWGVYGGYALIIISEACLIAILVIKSIKK